MPRAPSGLIEKNEAMEPQFMHLELPSQRIGPRHKSELTIALERLEIGGQAYVIPLPAGGGDAMVKRVRSNVANVRKRLGWNLTARRTKVGVEPVIAIWRLA